MGGEKKGVKRFQKGVEKARKKGGDARAMYNKGARSKPSQPEKKMEDVDMEDNVLKVKKHAADKVGGVNKHKKELQNLEEMDPEFFDFLKKNDANLLDFGNDEDDEEDSEDDDANMDDDSDNDSLMDEHGDNEGYDSEESKEMEMITVTEELLNDTLKAAQGGSHAALKKLMAIFRAACMPYGSDSHTSENLNEENDKKGMSRYQIPSGAIFEQTLQRVLEGAHKSFYLLRTN